MTDLPRVAEILGRRLCRMRTDGGDPRDVTPAVRCFAGFGFVPDGAPPGESAWVSLTGVSPYRTNNTAAEFVTVLTFPRFDLEASQTRGLFPLLSPDNPFGVWQTLQRHTYEGLETDVGGAAFSDPNIDAYDLGVSATSVSRRRKFTVDVRDTEVGRGVLFEGGQPTVYLAAKLRAYLPFY